MYIKPLCIASIGVSNLSEIKCQVQSKEWLCNEMSILKHDNTLKDVKD